MSQHIHVQIPTDFIVFDAAYNIGDYEQYRKLNSTLSSGQVLHHSGATYLFAELEEWTDNEEALKVSGNYNRVRGRSFCAKRGIIGIIDVESFICLGLDVPYFIIQGVEGHLQISEYGITTEDLIVSPYTY